MTSGLCQNEFECTVFEGSWWSASKKTRVHDTKKQGEPSNKKQGPYFELLLNLLNIHKGMYMFAIAAVANL